MKRPAALLAAVAILLQVVALPPLAMRMLSGLADASAVVLCTSHSAGPATGPFGSPADRQSVPGAGHDHAGCLVCQAHSLPVALVAASTAVHLVAVRWQADATEWLTTAPNPRFRHYSSRAPPPLA